MTCFVCGKTINGIPYIRSIISIKGKIAHYVCIDCFNTTRNHVMSYYKNNFANFANQYLVN